MTVFNFNIWNIIVSKIKYYRGSSTSILMKNMFNDLYKIFNRNLKIELYMLRTRLNIFRRKNGNLHTYLILQLIGYIHNGYPRTIQIKKEHNKPITVFKRYGYDEVDGKHIVYFDLYDKYKCEYCGKFISVFPKCINKHMYNHYI